jgi:hypothetical protein
MLSVGFAPLHHRTSTAFVAFRPPFVTKNSPTSNSNLVGVCVIILPSGNKQVLHAAVDNEPKAYSTLVNR